MGPIRENLRSSGESATGNYQLFRPHRIFRSGASATGSSGGSATGKCKVAQSLRKVAQDAGDGGTDAVRTVRTNPLKANGGIDADGAGASCPPRSSPKDIDPTWSGQL
jgi:hypothetical protein